MANYQRGAGAPAPSGPGSSDRRLANTHRNFNRVFGGPGTAPARAVAAQSRDPICTLGSPTARAPTLDGWLFHDWARRSRCGLTYAMLDVLSDDAWEVWRVAQVTCGLNGAQRALVRICQGAYQVLRSLRCDRAFVRDPLEACFIAVASSYLYFKGDPGSETPLRTLIADWGGRLPNYVVPAGATVSCSRQSDSFEWAMLIECGLVVTAEDWEITKGVSSRSALEEMSVSDIIDRGFHIKARECFPAAPCALRGVGCVPAGSSLPPLWSFRFFAEHVYGKGAPDGSRRAGAVERQRLDALIHDELLFCIVLGVAAERTTNQRTQVMPVEVINRVLAYDGEDKISTRHGALSVSATGARLMKARTVPLESHIEVRPFHVAGVLHYVPDELIDCAIPAPSSTVPATSSLPSRAPPVAQGDGVRAMGVERGNPSLPLGPRGTAPIPQESSARASGATAVMTPSAGAPSRVEVGRRVADDDRIPRLASPSLAELVRNTVDLAEYGQAYPHLRPVLARFGDQRRANLRAVMECLSGFVRSVGPDAAKASRRGSRGGTTVELRRVRQELLESRNRCGGLRRELDAMAGRVAQLSAQLFESSSALARPGKRRREDYDDDRQDDDAYRARRVRVDWGPRDSCRDPAPWRRYEPEGDGGSGFTA